MELSGIGIDPKMELTLVCVCVYIYIYIYIYIESGTLIMMSVYCSRSRHNTVVLGS